MVFTPRTFPEILNDMVAYVQANTELSDFSPGSLIRTILEAASLEDDEQYFQMIQLLNMFAIASSSGADLDRRLAEYNIYRLPAKTAFGRVRFSNTLLITDNVALDAVAGATSVTLFDTTGFPTSGYPYTIRIGEEGLSVQDVDVTNNDTASATFTLSGTTTLVSDIAVGDRVSLVTGGTTKLIAIGTEVEAPATVSSAVKKYVTQEPATIEAGNFFSNSVLVKANNAGPTGNTGVNTVTKFTGGDPFVGAGVTNITAIEGGERTESDKLFRERGLQQLQSLSRGTPLAIKSGATGVEDPSTGQRVTSANLLEDFVEDLVKVFIDDGTGFTPDSASRGVNNLNTAATGGSTDVLEVDDGSSFSSFGSVLLLNTVGDPTVDTELVTVISKNNVFLTLDAAVANSHVVDSQVLEVDVLTLSAETGQRRFRIQNMPVIFNTERILIKRPVENWQELTRDTDYIINYGLGEIQIIDVGGLPEGTIVVAHYQYYTNLIAQVQKVLEGDLDDPINFPGIKAAGITLRVEASVPKRINVRMTISAEEGFLETDLRDPVRRAVEDYINSLTLGEEVIVSKFIDVAYDVVGVKNAIVQEPTASTVVTLENELPVAFDVNGNSTVIVT